MLTISSEKYCPDSTYFRIGAVEPEMSADGAALTVYNGNGTRRSSWGAPGVTSTIVLHEDDLTSVHIGFHHKHGGGQFWRHYTANEQGQWQQVSWARLNDEQRQRVLNAADQHAPGWAKTPGKLRSAYATPTLTTRTTYKIVRVADDGRMVSLYDGETEYSIGKRLVERALDNHRGGYYSYPTSEGVKALFTARELVPIHCYVDGMRVAVLECEISGTILRYGGWAEWDDATQSYVRRPAKLASTYLKPVRVVETLTYGRSLQEAC